MSERMPALDAKLPRGEAVLAKEAARQQAVDAFKLIDTLNETAYDDITKLAASICGTKVALLSIVDGDRQWFRSKVGLEMTETSRDESFCVHAIEVPDEVMVVPDATLDARFATNPLVTGEPRIRFYAGAPLVLSSGDTLGALCVIDDKARDITPDQIAALAMLSRQVTAQIELRRLVSVLAKTNETLSHQSVTDVLTGIPNRRAYNHRVLEEFSRARRVGAPLSLLLIDVDHFKLYNDVFGHPAGDEAVYAVAQVLAAAIRPYDFLARYGGEEFVVLLPGTDQDRAVASAERLRQVVAAATIPHKAMTISVGVATLAPDWDIEHLLFAADRGLYTAKRTGRNRVVVGNAMEPVSQG
jgi:diguanylate cyclase (GGDEF)-like protein